MSDNSDAKIATADALTLLLHNQHAICAAIEELTKWFSESGVSSVAANAAGALETLDTNAEGLLTPLCDYGSRRPGIWLSTVSPIDSRSTPCHSRS